ncbi:30S ribosomal protein S18, partial [Candidatus Curtissbacteria bacterium RBG_16_39_7]
MRRSGRRRTIKRPVVRRNCIFCKEKRGPDYKETDILREFLSERGKILAQTRTGVCARHQRKLAGSIKRARFLAL